MSEENKVIILNDHMGVTDEVEVKVPNESTPDNEPVDRTPPTLGEETSSEEKKEEEATLLENPQDVSEQITLEKLQSMMTAMADSVKVLQSIWVSEAQELGLKPENMTALFDLNARKRRTPPDDLTEEEKKNWDYWNGLDYVEWEDLEPVFGKAHKCYGVDISQTRDRLKTACKDHASYIQMMTEYRSVHDGYLRLVEEEEHNQIKELEKMIAENPDNPAAEAAKKSIQQYYDLKYLNWIAQPLSDEVINRIVFAMGNEEKISYYIHRTMDKLKQLDVSGQFIQEISKFEDRLLEEKYKSNSQVLLAFFVHFVTFANIKDTPTEKSLDKTKIICFVHGVDQLIRKTCMADMGEAIMNNILALEDQFLGKTPQPKK